MPNKKSAKEIFTMLTNEDWEHISGKLIIDMMGISTIINDKSLIGYALQNWLGDYLTKNNVYFRVPDNSQEFPDFYLSESNTENLLELKTFDADAGANFDIANFEAYCRSIETNQYRLNADYLIISYTLREGVLKICNIWLKKIWEISCPSEAYPVKVQQKQNMIYNLRPANWDSQTTRYKVFPSKGAFVRALYETRSSYHKTADTADEWYEKVKKGLL
jgi:hypothetical protein